MLEIPKNLRFGLIHLFNGISNPDALFNAEKIFISLHLISVIAIYFRRAILFLF